ncbi:MAG: HmuY family protein [Microscillaceae bacterium]
MALAFLKACGDDDASTPKPLRVEIFERLPALQTGGMGQPVGEPFNGFSISAGDIVNNDDRDIAFRGTTILASGGDEIGISDEPTRTGNAAIFQQDGPNAYALPTGSGNGWYNYDPAQNLIIPIVGKVFVVRTHDGKYAKFEILSDYQNAPNPPDPTAPSRYYTFKNMSISPIGQVFKSFYSQY